MKKTDYLKAGFAVLALASVCFFGTGVCMYIEWLKTIKLYNAGLIMEYSLKYQKIVEYEPSIYLMGIGAVLGIIDATLFAIVKVKNGKEF